MRGWSVVSGRWSGLSVERVCVMIDGVTSGFAVNLGTRTAPLVVEHRTGPDHLNLVQEGEWLT